MRPAIRSPHAPRWLATLLLVVCLGALLLSTAAQAQRFPMTLELTTGEVAEFGAVHVEADAEGGILFEVEIDPTVVGDRASLHHLYLNLEPALRRLRIETLDPDAHRPYRIHRSWRRLSRSGARFDWKVDLGVHRRRDRGERGVGRHHASFRISAGVPLAVEDLLPISMTRQGEVVQMALKLHKARTSGGHVRYVGGTWEPPIVEPPAEEPPAELPPSTDLPDPDSLPPAPEGCRWVVDLFGGGDPVLTCG